MILRDSSTNSVSISTSKSPLITLLTVKSHSKCHLTSPSSIQMSTRHSETLQMFNISHFNQATQCKLLQKPSKSHSTSFQSQITTNLALTLPHPPLNPLISFEAIVEVDYSPAD
jgi:hypothetical protein